MKSRVAENLRVGATLIETVIAVALLAAVLTLTLQTLTAMKAARRDHQRRQVALQEAANCLERLRTYGPDDLEKVAAEARLSEAARQTLPGGKLQVELAVDAATGGKRVEVQVQWQTHGGEIEAPIKLSAWALGEPLMRRSGYSLTEVLVTIVVSSVVLATVTGLLGTLFVAERHGRDHLQRIVALDRLARQFRNDVHAANAADAATDTATPGPRLSLKMPDGREVSYHMLPESLAREEKRDGEIAHRDSFRLPSPAKTLATVEEQPGGRVVRLAIALSSVEAGQETGRMMQFEALLAADAKLGMPRRN